MKRIGMAALVAVLAVMLMAAVTQATTLTLQSSHTLTPTVIDKATGNPLSPTGGSIQSGVDGNSYWDPTQNPSANSQTATLNMGTSSSVNASLNSLTWLQTTTANVSYSGANNTFTMSQNYVASAPNPFNGVDGYFIQNGSLSSGPNSNIPTYFSLTYELVEGGDYHVSLVDAYSFLYQLVNSAGSSNLFDTTYGELLLMASITYSGGSYTANQYIVGADAPDSRTGTPVSNFTLENNAGTATLQLDITDAHVGTLTFAGYLIADDHGNSYASPVPVPPSLLLLGSGLVGLLALGWRRKKPTD